MALLDPLALVFAGLYGVLVLFYLWERWRRRVVVPSLLLWQAVREDVIRARRFRPDWLFVLQLLVLTCLILGLARPYWHAPGTATPNGRHILVLDTTASMQAREGKHSRWDEAQGQAIKLLSELPAEAEVMLVTAARTPQVVINFTRDHDAVAAAVTHATPTDTGGDMSRALAFADSARQRSDVPTYVDVFTDVPRRELPAPLRDHVTVFQTGETDDNLGIEALQIFQGRFQDYHGARAYVLVENFAHREEHGFLTVRLADQIVNRNGFTISARQSKGFLIHGFPGPGRVTAQLEVADALAADNRAFGWIRPVSPVRVLMVSPPSSLLDDLQELAAATPGLQLTSIAPEDFSNRQAAQADIVIFHRFTPPSPTASNALYIYPPEHNRLFPASANAEAVEVLDWNGRHPALQSLRPLAALPLHRARIVSPPPWSTVLLSSRTAEREFPLAFAGEDGGHRVACVTFDLEAERLLSSDNINLFLLFMNLLGWLAPEGSEARVVSTGGVETFDDLADHPLQIRDPRGAVSMLPPGHAVVEPLFAGEYELRSDGTQRTLLANFFDPTESDIGRASKEPPIFPSPSVEVGRTRPQDGARREYGSWLYAAAIALFLLEWGVARRSTP